MVAKQEQTHYRKATLKAANYITRSDTPTAPGHQHGDARRQTAPTMRTPATTRRGAITEDHGATTAATAEAAARHHARRLILLPQATILKRAAVPPYLE